MTLIVDFNMTQEDSLVPALLSAPNLDAIHIGDKVSAVDGEGTACKAEVITVTESARGKYALLRPIGGSWRQDSKHRLSTDDLLAR